MPDSKRLYHRQDLLLLNPTAQLICNDEDKSKLCNWLQAERPVIVCRPAVSEKGVHCAISLPLAEGKKGIAFIAPFNSVKQILSLPKLQDSSKELTKYYPALPEKLYALNPYIFGSFAWQLLSGENYLHNNSDLDLLFKPNTQAELTELLQDLARIDLPFLDIEIMLWNKRAFSYREYCRSNKDILIKSDQRVFLFPKRLLSEKASSSKEIAAQACEALFEELEAFPKPGLVSFIDNGSHNDMTAKHFIASISSLEVFFAKAADAGRQRASFEQLKEIGIAAEKAMLQATSGINTHRGAIFSLGLLCAAAARQKQNKDKRNLGEIVKDLWGKEILQHSNPDSHGAKVFQLYGVKGARQEAAEGFSNVYKYALSTLKQIPERNEARIITFFQLLQKVKDSNLLHRGGEKGLNFAQKKASDFLQLYNKNPENWQSTALAIHKQFIELNLSAGGVADLLAAAIFIQKMEEKWQL